MKSALLNNTDIVINIAIGVPDGYIECPDEVGIGWAYDGEDWTAPIPPEPVTAAMMTTNG